MLHWFVLGALSVAGVAVVSVTSVASVAAHSGAARSMEDARRLTEAARTLERRVAFQLPYNVPTLPEGVQGGPGEGYNLPLDFPVMRLSTRRRPIVYCPMPPDAGRWDFLYWYADQRTITDPSGSVFALWVRDGRVVGGRRDLFPLASDPEVLGFVIMPLRGDSSPGCLDLRVENGVPVVPDGIVRVVRRTRETTQSVAATRQESIYFVSPLADPAASGASPAVPTTVTEAMRRIREERPDHARIVFAPGLYQVPFGTFDLSGLAARPGLRASLSLVAARPGTVGVIQAVGPGGALGLVRGDVSLLLAGIDFHGTTGVVTNPARVLHVHGVRLATVEVVPTSSAALSSVVLAAPAAGVRPLVIRGGKASVSDVELRCAGVGCVGALVQDGGQLRLARGILRLQRVADVGLPAAGVWVDGNSGFFAAPGTRVQAETPMGGVVLGADLDAGAAVFVLNGGELAMRGALLTTTEPVRRAVYAGPGAVLHLTASTIEASGAGRFDHVVRDAGLVSFVAMPGNNARLVASVSCWDARPGTLLARVPDGNGATGRGAQLAYRPADREMERDDAGQGEPAPRFALLSPAPTPAETRAHVQSRLADVEAFRLRVWVQNRLGCVIA